MNTKAPEPAAWIDAMAPIVGLPIAAEHRPGVIANLEVAARMAAILEAVELDEDAEPAPVFTA